MKFVVTESQDLPGTWYVEAETPEDSEETCGAIFYGRNAKQRAEGYARWMTALSLKEEVLAVRPR